MISVIICFGYLLIFLAAGLSVSRWIQPTASVAVHTVFSAGFGLVFLTGLPALFALVFGFRLSAALLAGLVALILACRPFLASRLFRGQPQGSLTCTKGSPAFWLCVLPLLFFTVWLLHTHTLYWKDGGYWCGQSTYSDLPMHLNFIKSIAEQGLFPPVFPMLAGQELYGYPFLCESVSSVFLLFGASLKFACILPQVVALVAVFGGGWVLADELLGSHIKATLAYWLFFSGSGFGFVYFINGDWQNFTRIFTAYYETPTNYVQENIRWVNPIADLLVPQRATLFGWAFLFPCLILLVRFAFKNELQLWPALILMAACIPLVQTHSALALVLICLVLFLRAVLQYKTNPKALAAWVRFGVGTALVWIPLVFTQIIPHTQEGSGFLRWHFNWANEGDFYLWFYIKNIGIVYLLLIPAFVHAKKNLRWLYGGGLLILLISEFIEFQPNNYDNNKLLYIWHLLGCILVANLLVDLLQRIPAKKLQAVAAAFVVFLGTFGSVLTLGREAVSHYQHFNSDAIAVADYVEENTDPLGRFLTGTQLLNPVLSLAGRSILCASSTWLYFHGMDYSVQEQAVAQLYEFPSQEALAQWDIAYVMISNAERNDYTVNEAWFQQNCILLFQQGEYTIYQVA